MKNTIKVIISLILIFILTSCESDSNYDVNELLTAMNEKYEYDFQYEDFTITKNKNYIYSTIVNKNILLTFYCNNNCEIEQCTITSEEDSDLLNKLCQQIATIMVGDIDNFNIYDSEYNGWKIKRNENKAGITVIINRTNNQIHDNNYRSLNNISLIIYPIYCSTEYSLNC